MFYIELRNGMKVMTIAEQVENGISTYSSTDGISAYSLDSLRAQGWNIANRESSIAMEEFSSTNQAEIHAMLNKIADGTLHLDKVWEAYQSAKKAGKKTALAFLFVWQVGRATTLRPHGC